MKLKKIGFLFNGHEITDPTKDETGRQEVNPYFYYGRAYLNSAFFETKPNHIFELIHCDPAYDIQIKYVNWEYFSEDNGFSKETIKEVGRLEFNKTTVIDDGDIVVKRMI